MNFKTGDINILLSMINLKLRDEFSDFDDLVSYYNVQKKQINLKENNFNK